MGGMDDQIKLVMNWWCERNGDFEEAALNVQKEAAAKKAAAAKKKASWDKFLDDQYILLAQQYLRSDANKKHKRGNFYGCLAKATLDGAGLNYCGFMGRGRTLK